MATSERNLAQALGAALGNNASLYALPNHVLYLEEHVKRYNLDVKNTPAAVTYPETTAQVAAIVKVAVEHGLHVQPRSGGHSYANFSVPDGGILVDLKHFKQYSIDATTWRATVGAGTALGDLTKSMYNSHRRAMAHGVCPQVGIGGHATIGGLGPSSRLWGAALDHVEEVEVVLADSTIVRASEGQHSDLFWALKGAAAGFGIITEFVVRTEPAPSSLVQYSFSFTTGSWDDMASDFKDWQKFVSNKDLTWNFASTANLTEVGLIITGTFYGTREEYDAIMGSATFPGKASKHTIEVKDWLAGVAYWWEEVALLLGGGLPAHMYSKSLTFNGCDLIPDSVIDKMFNFFKSAKKGTLVWFAIFDLAGGFINTIAPDATAYAHRDALYYMQSYAIGGDLFRDVSSETKKFLTDLNHVIESGMREAGEKTDFGAYPGYVDLELKSPQRDYWRYNLPRLELIKTKYDAGDVFRNSQTVKPNGKDGNASQ
jgi:FAD binding domain/Berberine and berberine like